MNEIPLEEQRVIDELVQFWQSGYEPRDLITHLDRLSSTWGSGVGVGFFRRVYRDICTGNHSTYITSSASEFKRFLEIEYSRQAQIDTELKAQALVKAEAERKAREKAEAERRAREKAEAERQAQEEAKEREELQRRARIDFDILGKEIAKATVRAERIELGRKRADLAKHVGLSFTYVSHCWNCKAPISSNINAQCLDCGYYICNSCTSCFCPRIVQRDAQL